MLSTSYINIYIHVHVQVKLFHDQYYDTAESCVYSHSLEDATFVITATYYIGRQLLRNGLAKAKAWLV